MLDADGFTQKLVWDESQWVDGAPTAFVAADARGRELDVHVVEAGPDGRLVQRYDSPWPLPDAIAAHGVIAGLDVNCVSRQAQVAMHTGYPLPAAQVRDLELLRAD
jgi:lincosamide nucleotidyltransferase A/C/D/E